MVDCHLPSGHFETLLTKMNQDRLEGRFCDVQLTVHSQHITVHRCVLAASSPYFSGMFSGNFLETDKGMTTVDLSDSVDELVHLDTVVSALYTGQLHLARSNIGAVTQLVSFLMVDSLKDLCVQFLLSDIHLQTSVNYFVLADMYDIDEVESYSFSMLESRFHDYFIYQEEILQVSPHHLNILFQRSIQRYCDSSQILQLLFSWAGYRDVCKRLPSAKHLFHSMCVGLDSRGLAEMDTWLEIHRGEEESVAAEFVAIVRCIMDDPEMPEDSAKTPEIDNYVNSAESPDSKSGASQNVLDPVDPTAESSLSPSMSTTSLHGSEVMSDVMHTGADNSNGTQCVVVLAPVRDVVQSVLELEARQKIRLSSTSLDISFYNPAQRIWLNFGTVTFPGVFDERGSWRSACTHDKLYFLSAVRESGYCLDLTTRTWQTLNCSIVLDGLEGNVRSVIPLAVGGALYVLASNRLLSESRDHYKTQQRYYRLTDRLTWDAIAEVSHDHYSTPLSLISVSGTTIYVIKADIAVNVAKNLLIIKEGHTFDTKTKKVEKFSAITYVPSPVRVMVKDGTIYIIDGEGWMRPYNRDKGQWEFPTQVDLSDVRWCRAASIEGHFPCMSQVSAGAGGRVWELTSLQNNATTLLEVAVGCEAGLQTRIHIPPPYKYFALATAGTIKNSVIKSLPRSLFLHD